jgi:hypothetical protein
VAQYKDPFFGKGINRGSKLFFGLVKKSYKVGKAVASQSSKSIKRKSLDKSRPPDNSGCSTLLLFVLILIFCVGMLFSAILR